MTKRDLALIAYSAFFEITPDEVTKFSGHTERNWSRAVDAILEALMEPSEGMLNAGENTFSPSYTGTPISSPGAVWQAMLKHIKEES